jgi:hypothetical protein
MSDDELNGWRSEWQRLGQTQGTAEELVRRASKDLRRMRAAAMAEVLAALCSSAFSVWLVVRSHGAVEIASIAATVLAFNGAWLTHYFSVRQGVLSPSAGSTREYVELTRKRLQVEQRWNQNARRWTLALSVVLLPWCVWMFTGHFEFYRAAPWRGVVGFGGMFVILGGLFAFMHRKRQTIGKKIEAFERQIADLELT